ncbi:MAG: CvpA family protein [Gammaproteobacteria bacterium]
MTTSWIDALILIIIAISTLIGLFRGLLRETISIVTWIAVIWIGIAFSRHLAPWLPESWDKAYFTIASMEFNLGNLRMGVAFVILMVLVLIIGVVVSRMLTRMKEAGSLGFADRVAGMFFGIVRGCVIVTLVVLAAGMTQFPQTPWWEQSVAVRPFQHAATWVVRYLPEKLAKRFKFV